MAENSSQRHTELIAKVFLELGAQLPPHERERLSFSVEKILMIGSSRLANAETIDCDWLLKTIN